ncbi:MAG: dolichyl-phosphate beta-glucosyltransferase [Candidatus Komeilibacteria bacterium]
MLLSVVIPAYNEASVIATTLRRVVSFLDQHYAGNFEIIVADDGSLDSTAQLVSTFQPVKLLPLPHRGKGAAVRSGVLAAQGQVILFTDADNSTDIDHLPAFLSALDRADIVIGSRQIAQANVLVAQPWLKRTLGRLGNGLIRLLLVPGISDTQCGFKMFRSSCRVLFQLQTRDDWAFDFELLFLARKKGLVISELPVRWVNNFASKVKPWSYITTLLAVFSVQYNYWTHRYKL